MSTLPVPSKSEIAAPLDRALTRDEMDKLAELLGRAKAPATRRAYAAGLAAFDAWCESHDLTAHPAQPETVALFIQAEADAGRTVSTIRQRLAAIGWRHEAAGLDSPTARLGVREAMKAIRRELGVKPKQAAPATAERVLAMASHSPDTLAGLRDRALLLFGFATAMRRSELAGLDVSDLEDADHGLLVNLRRSKADQEGEGHERGVSFGSSNDTCPVKAVRDWQEAAGIYEGPLFRSVDRHGNLGTSLDGKAVDRIVKRYAKAAKLKNAREFSGHLLRAGFITSAAKAGRTADEIMDHTGHKSHAMIRLYTRREDVWTNNAGRGLL